MLSKQAREVKAYLSSDEGRGILRTARMVLRANNIKVQDDDVRGLKSLVLAYALYPNQLQDATGGLVQKTAKGPDFCQLDPSLCKGKQAIPRMEMPVLEGKFLLLVANNLAKGFIDWQETPKDPYRARYAETNSGDVVEISGLSESELSRLGIRELGVEGIHKYHQKSANGDMKVSVKQMKVPATELKPTQAEINFGKSFGMASSYMSGSFPSLLKYDPETVSLVSKEGYIIDGHHRWAAIGLLNTYSESKLMWGGEDIETTLLELVAKKASAGEIGAWLKDNKGGGVNAEMPILYIGLSLKSLLPCLNACTDSLGVTRKPFDEKNKTEKDKIVIPKNTPAYQMKVHDLKDISGPTDVLQQKDLETQEDESIFEKTRFKEDFDGRIKNLNQTRLARLKNRLRSW